MKDLRNKTMKRIGKIDLLKSLIIGKLSVKYFRYENKEIKPVKKVARTSNSVKSNIILATKIHKKLL
jgi:hypothetical protein